MSKKQTVPQWYQDIVDRHTPRKKILRNCVTAFLAGGALCAAAQAGQYMLMIAAAVDKEEASGIVLTAVIFLTALFTGLGIYDKAGQKAGAGLAVPISGFANSVAASMLEHKSEGYVLGSGCNSFKLAGSVVVFGIASAFVSALAAWLLGA